MASRGSFASILVMLAVFLLLGGPAVFFTWPELSELLYGRVGEVRFVRLFLGAALFAVLIVTMARWVRGLGPAEREGA